MRQLFTDKWKPRTRSFEWKREDLTAIAQKLGIVPPKNLGDNIYAVRHGREDLPEEIRKLARGKAWLLLPNGRGHYKFVKSTCAFIEPDLTQKPIKIPDSTPQIVARSAKDDEQATLARIRYCRLIDIFLGIASFQLQSHMRTTLAYFNSSQVELDDVYVGVDSKGRQFVVPVQAKGPNERIGAVQLVTDHFACIEKFPGMTGRTIAAKTIRIEEDPGYGQIFTIALIEVAVSATYEVTKVREKHYRLLPAALL